MASEPGEFRVDDFSYGYVDKLNADALPPGASRDCRNVISKVQGRLDTRNGVAELNATAIAAYGIQGLTTFYNNAGLKYLVAVCNGSVCYWDGAAFKTIKTGLDATAMVLFENCIIDGKDVIVGFNGVDTPFYWDGTAATDPVTDVTTSFNMYEEILRESLTADANYLVYTVQNSQKPIKTGTLYVYSNATLLAGTDYTADLTNGTVTFAAARLNVVTKGATTAYLGYTKFIAPHPFVSTETVTVYDKDDNVLTPSEIDYEAGSVTFTTEQTSKAPLTISYTWADEIKADYFWSWGTVPATTRYPQMHKLMLFTTDSTSALKSTLRWTLPNDYENWDPVYTWEVNPGDGDEITALRSVSGELQIYKTRSIHSFRGAELNDPRLDTLDENIGCAGPMAVCVDGTNTYFISEKGIYKFNGAESENISDGRIPVLWSSLNKQYLNKAIAIMWESYVWFFLPYGSSTTNNLLLIYDPSSGAYWPMNATLANVSCAATFSTQTGLKLYGGNTTNGKVYELDTGTDDAGTVITAYWEPANFDAKASDKPKRAKYIFVEDSEDTTIPFSVSAGLDNAATLTSLTAIKTQGVERKFNVRPDLVGASGVAGEFRHFALRLSRAAAGRASICSVVVPYKIKTKSKL